MYPVRYAIIQGLLLPLRMYFQPRSVAHDTLRYETMGKAKPSPTLIYLSALVWIPIGISASLLVFGIPEGPIPGLPKHYNLLLLLVMCGLSVIVSAMAVGSGYHFVNGRVARQTFKYDVAAGFGVVLALMFFFDFSITDKFTAGNNLNAVFVIDLSSLAFLKSINFGVALGVIASIVGAYHFNAKRFLLFGGLPLSIGMIALLSNSKPEVRAANLVFSIIAMVLMTHLIWQPFYFVTALTSNLLVQMDPRWSQWLWRISPARWSEFSYVPLPGLSNLLLTLYRIDVQAGLQAVDCLKRHPFYNAIGVQLSKSIYPMDGSYKNTP